VLLPALLTVACGEEKSPVPDAGLLAADAAPAQVGAPDAGAAEASAAGTDATVFAEAGGVASDAGAGTNALGVVVVHTDYKTTAVSLVDPASGTVTKDNCIGSGSKAPQLTTALSGDVVPPTQPQPTHEVVLIDRQNATLTWVTPSTCEVARQLNIGEGKMANPQDLITISPTKGYVSRYASSHSDLAIIDPATAKITGRIDLEPHTPKAAGGRAVAPNPSRGVYARGKVYVVLTSLSEDYKYAATGRVVVVDPATDAVSGTIDLPPLKNCGSAAYLESAGALVVACGGLYGDPNQILDSGVAWIDLAASPPAVKVVLAAAFGRALSPFDAAAHSAYLAFAITGGEFSGTPPDQLWAFDPNVGAPRKLLDGKKAYTLSGLLVDPASKRLLVADAAPGAPKLHLFDLTDPGAPTLETSLTSSATGLPPKYLSWY
jgi:hypothetical protein